MGLRLRLRLKGSELVKLRDGSVGGVGRRT